MLSCQIGDRGEYRLIELNQHNEDTEEAIEQLCSAEIALLEEGYPKKSIANQYLPDYTR